MFKVAKSSGKPSKLLRSAPVTNSSISLPVWLAIPRTMLPAAARPLSGSPIAVAVGYECG
ncbi:unannotated protein [freshwater metagenome]|uniref:Unannotated protein n=1 Tax=freshwater metagenome TaxID=449393 RepID=A0A6J5YWI0_9ZZZZ